MALKTEVKEKIKESQDCRNRLAYELRINPLTLTRWMAADDISIESSRALKIISEEIAIPVELLIEK